MERKIGEIFEYNGEWYQCVGGRCKDCHFSEKRYICKQFITKHSCTSGIMYKKLKKVGEPYEHCGKLYQCYKLPMEIEIRLLPNNCNPIGKDNLVEIEVKQTKKDMKEKNNGNTPLNVLTDKYVNGDICYDDFEKEVKALYSCKEEIKLTLKDFDLEAAKQGKPVCTRDGRKARIICFDRRINRSIVALIEWDNHEEGLQCYYDNGRYCCDVTSGYDLMMLPEKKEGWVNVYKERIYDTKEEAIEATYDGVTYVDTIKINWEE